MKELNCVILDISNGISSPNITYGVFDGEQQVSQGVSSSIDWVKNDAGGFHTKKKFDKLYPDGWIVNFNF